MRRLQKSIHYSLDDANLGAEIINWNRKFREAVDECLVELSLKNSINGSLPELFNLPFLHNTTDRFEENNLYPFLHLLPDGNLFIFANRRSISFDYVNNRVVKEFPEIPGEKRNYPAADSSVLLPLRENSPAPEVMIWGGAPAFAFYQAEKLSVYVAASKTCGRLKVTDPNLNG
ncbi:hypothetical protein ACSBR2_039970 [Camellia fascicularis]